MSRRASLEPGGKLGRYELLSQIAQGGMASVWAARQTGSHGFRKTVAIKTILPNLSDDPQFERMFLTEAKFTMRVTHPNVAQTLDLGEENGLLYLVMEWIDGESLSSLLKAAKNAETPLPLKLGVLVCARACRGLHAAHEVTDEEDRPVGIVHRDVSPQNVMVTYDGQVKVLDFGVAKGQLEGSATQTGMFKGKIPYMAPEQAVGGKIDRRTDVFAMGTLLYRVTVGQHPFMGANQSATLNNVIQGLHELPTKIDVSFPQTLEQIIERCLAKEPDHRYQTIEEVADALEQLLPQLGGATEQELGAFVKRHLGEVRKQRREAMRDAAKALGWAVATSESLPRVSIDPSLTPPSIASGPASVRTGPSSTGLSHAMGPASRTLHSRKKSGWGVPALLGALVLVSAVAGVALMKVWTAREGGDVRSATAGTTSTVAPSPSPATAAPLLATMAAPSAVPAPPAVTAEASAATSAATAQPRPRPGGFRPTKPTKTSDPSWGTGPDLGF